MIESETGVVEIDDMDACIFQEFLKYLYSGRLPALTVDMARELYKAGDKYAVGELKTACAEFLTNNLTPENACEMLVLADQHCDIDFKKNVTTICVDEMIPLKDELWNFFSICYPELANEVLNCFLKLYCLNEDSRGFQIPIDSL